MRFSAKQIANTANPARTATHPEGSFFASSTAFAFFVLYLVVIGSLALTERASAQTDTSTGRLSALELSAACAPPPGSDVETPTGLKVLGAQDSSARTLYGERDLLLVNGGRKDGLEVNQEFIIRRPTRLVARDKTVPSGITTVGALRIISMNDTMSLAMVEYACTGISQNDYLVAYAPPALPEDADQPLYLSALDFDSLDFSAMLRILRGAEDKLTGGVGDYMVMEGGANQGVTVGTRFAVYRDLIHPTMPMPSGGRFAIYAGNVRQPLPLAPVGEVIVISIGEDTALVRVTQSRDAVQYGDYLVRPK
jgi:hypothetical protein